MFKSLFKNKQQRLNSLLRVSIHQRNIAEVEKLLGEGADPNAFADSSARYRPLADAMRCNAPLPIIDALLRAGANPLEPYRWLGGEFILSEAAGMSGLPKDIVQRLKLAEQEAEAKYGPRGPLREYQEKSCPPPKYFP